MGADANVSILYLFLQIYNQKSFRNAVNFRKEEFVAPSYLHLQNKLKIMFESFLNYFELLATLCILFLLGLFMYEFRVFKKTFAAIPVKNEEGDKLKLQALERLTLYAERSGLQNLISRLDSKGMSVADLHHLLTETLKAEYEYNLTQQIYVSPEVWHAVTRLKEQNIYVINHITSNLPPHATALDLCKMIVEYSATPNAEMNVLVLDAIQFEAKKMLN